MDDRRRWSRSRCGSSTIATRLRTALAKTLATTPTTTVATVALIAVAACSMHRTDTDAPDRTVITSDQIDSVHAMNAYEAVDRLQPVFLVGRGKMSLQPGAQPALPNVYVDNQYYGDASVLRSISAAMIASIKFYSASEAQYKFGRGNEAGAIGITTKR